MVEPISGQPIDQRIRFLRAGASSSRVTRFAIVAGLVAVAGSALAGYSAFTASRQAHYNSIARSNLLTARDMAEELRAGEFEAFSPGALELVRNEWSALRHNPAYSFLCVIDEEGRMVMCTSQTDMTRSNVDETVLGLAEPDNSPRTVGDLLGTNDEWSGLNRRGDGQRQIAAYIGVPGTGGGLSIHTSRDGLDDLVLKSTLPWWIALATMTLLIIPLSMVLLQQGYRTAHDRSEEAIDELCGSLEFQRLLLSELDHRVRNNLASLKALIDISRTNHSDLATYSTTIKGRIQTMAEVHTLLSVSRWTNVDLRSLLLRLVPDAHRSALHIEGGDVHIPARQAGAIGMVLHELITNSIKHGSLGAPEGRVAVAWSLDAADSPDLPTILNFTWREHGGPPVAASDETGIGSSLIRGLVESEMRGRALLQYPPEGVHHELTMHLDSGATTFDESMAPASIIAASLA